MNAVHDLHLQSQEGTLSPHQFNDKTVIVVTDFAKTGTAFQAALNFLKPASTKVIVVASAVVLQGALGILTLLSGVKLGLGLAHQAGAAIVLIAAVWHLHATYHTGVETPA